MSSGKASIPSALSTRSLQKYRTLCLPRTTGSDFDQNRCISSSFIFRSMVMPLLQNKELGYPSSVEQNLRKLQPSSFMVLSACDTSGPRSLKATTQPTRWPENAWHGAKSSGTPLVARGEGMSSWPSPLQGARLTLGCKNEIRRRAWLGTSEK